MKQVRGDLRRLEAGEGGRQETGEGGGELKFGRKSEVGEGTKVRERAGVR